MSDGKVATYALLSCVPYHFGHNIYICLIVKETHSALWILKKAEESAKRAIIMGCRSVVEWICPCTKNLIELASFIQRFSNVAAATLVTIPLPLYICTVMSYEVLYCFGTDIQKCRKTLQIYY